MRRHPLQTEVVSIKVACIPLGSMEGRSMGDTSPTPSEARAAARTWLEENWRGADDATWKDAVVSSGWAAPTWPIGWYGRGLDREAARAAVQEFDAVAAPHAGQDLADFHVNSWLHLMGDPLQAYGSDEVKGKFLPMLLRGVGRWLSALLGTWRRLRSGRTADQG